MIKKRTQLIFLLYIALFTGCGLFKGTNAKQNAEADNSSWELLFMFVGSTTSVPFDKLYLDGRIPMHRMWFTIANFKTDKCVIVVKYTGIGKAKAMEVCDKLEEDKQIELLSLMQIEFR